jgi:hypothetical protein
MPWPASWITMLMIFVPGPLTSMANPSRSGGRLPVVGFERAPLEFMISKPMYQV